MPTLLKNSNIEFKEDSNRIDHYKLLTASPRLSSLANPKNLFFDIRILEPEQFSFPYHFHRNAEELMAVLEGTMTVRTEKGMEILSAGDMVFFEIGESGAHQFYNHSAEPCKYLDIRTFYNLDVCEYPDSGKVNIIPPFDIFEKKDKVGYFKGEENVVEKWEELRYANKKNM